MQVMLEWIEKAERCCGGRRTHPSAKNAQGCGTRGRSVGRRAKLLDYVHGRESACKQLAFKDLNQFDRKQWRQWARSLPQRGSRVRPGSAVYLHLALEKWTAAHDLHKRALRTRSQVSWHALRIGLKRFRYTVENFLPRQHALWGDDLKELQDLLGEVHDLDVLWAMAVEIAAFPDVESRNRWREKLNAERSKRIERYREKMVGRESLWRVWRAELPSGPQLRAAAMSRLRTWAGYLDPDFAHSERVTQLALLLYDGLKDAGLVTTTGSAVAGTGSAPDLDHDWRAVLQAAALMHDVGKAKGAENHQKASYRMIRGMARPLGWSAREMEMAAVVARYHRGPLPRPQGKTVQLLEFADRPLAMQLSGILRLANALDKRNGRESANPPRLEVNSQDRFVVVRVAGYSALDRSAEEVASARHLLETVLRRPVLVRTLRRSAGGSRRPQRLKPALGTGRQSQR